MLITRLFRSGNSQAVRIPAELAYSDQSQEMKITRLGDVITVFPARGSAAEMVAALNRLPRPSNVEIREPIEVPEREA